MCNLTGNAQSLLLINYNSLDLGCTQINVCITSSETLKHGMEQNGTEYTLDDTLVNRVSRN